MTEERLDTLYLSYFDGTKRKVRVYVPAHKEEEKLPVIYMTDGQNLFEYGEQQFGCWYTREAVRENRGSGGEGAIIVGIHNDTHPLERGNELLPKSIGKLFFPPEIPEEMKSMYNPKGELFDDFVINTVMTEVEKCYPVKTGKENTAFCGSSSGGLESFYIALSHPDIFGKAGVFSPAFMMYDKEDFEKWIRAKADVETELPFLYMYTGGNGDLEKQIDTDFKWVIGILNDCYPSDKLKAIEITENPHNETAWASQFPIFLNI